MRLTSLASALAIGLLAIPMTGCDENALEPNSDSAVRPTASILTADAPNVELGRELYFDKSLSRNGNQSCASCHDPKWGFTGPNPAVNDRGAVYAGSFRQRFGNRKPPSAAYATFAPIRYYDYDEGLWIGGNFWDGRATGEKLGNPAADQALGPFLNPVEQALPDRSCVVYLVREGNYSDLFHAVWGMDLTDLEFPKDMKQQCRRSTGDFDAEFSPEDEAAIDAAYDQVGLSIAAFEASAEVNPFSSKYDAWKAGMEEFTDQEELGFELFIGEKALCSACHIADLADSQDLFTDFSFDNLGVPKNPESPAYKSDPTFVDLGLGGSLFDLGENGKQKVPTLRNVGKRPGTQATKAYMHNGYFKTLEQVVNFYNTRDVKDVCPGPYTADEAMAADCWPAPEVAANVNSDELGDLGLTAEEEAAIVAFMLTLSDR
ncbi:MAG: cytochrome C [marine benthic group bacterium]|jgi:cytochrome c peroxidase|nr:cytochrome C [Gemmatimonadota bacterium]